MTGGAGSDFFAVILNGGADVITDFNRDEDSILLSMDILSQLPDTFQGARDVAAALYNANVPMGTSGYTVSSGRYGYAPVLIFDAATQMLSFDQDGLAGEGTAIDLVRLVGVTHLDGSEFFARPVLSPKERPDHAIPFSHCQAPVPAGGFGVEAAKRVPPSIS